MLYEMAKYAFIPALICTAAGAGIGSIATALIMKGKNK